MRTLKTMLLVICTTCILSGCKKNESWVTGWPYDSSKRPGYESPKQVKQETPKGMVFIEGGAFVMGSTTDNVRYDWNNQPRTVTVSSFYMDQCEITNHHYRDYIKWLTYIYGTEYPEIVQRAMPDQAVWRDKLSHTEKLVENYFSHASYALYPVVGVMWSQAVDFCNWRSDRVNEEILMRDGYLEYDPDQTYENNFNTDAYLAGLYEGIVKKEIITPGMEEPRRVQMEDGILLPRFRLPTEAEWEYAALALIGNTTKDGRVADRKVYPWNGHVVRTDNNKYYGKFLANYMRGGGDAMGVAGDLNDECEYTCPVFYYFPNDYGLFHMAGNVAEWCLDVYRPTSGLDVTGVNPFRGNVYMTKVLDEEGLISEKDSLGRILYREVTVEENVNRMNYRQADNINYLDGDYASTVALGWDQAPEENTTDRMYGYGLSSTINDKSRVIKGGSWRDRAYFLSPGQRRYMDQAQSTDWVGFRCAMDRLGSSRQ